MQEAGTVAVGAHLPRFLVVDCDGGIEAQCADGGLSGYKPTSSAELTLELHRAIQRASRGDFRGPVRPLPEILGESSVILRTCELARQVAPSDASVLITGESGTGKELFARAIHRESGCAGKFVAVNCAAVPEQLLESELFGHVRGAFTDAKTSSAGLFVEADHGTLFLDEIGEMPISMQTKLLRALEERTVRPVGGTREVPFDARIVAATNENLEAQLEAGRFRHDLFYRINVVQITVPPLRDRERDAVVLARAFLESVAARTGKQVRGMTQEVVEKLLKYPFPGNVRELVNAIERSVALSRGGPLAPDDLPPAIRDYDGELPQQTADNPGNLLPLRELERRHIKRVLAATGGNKTQAAKILGLDRCTLYRKLARADARS